MSQTIQRRALWLVGATAAWDIVEAAAALILGIQASSVALTAFGLDSVIEIVAACTLLWRLRLEFRGETEATVERAERKALRLVGWTFLLLATYVTVRGGLMLLGGHASETSALGIALAVAALAVMGTLAWAKLRAATLIGSRALRAEARESIACMYLSAALLVGLSVHSLFGWWWGDPVAALAMVPWLVREGRESLAEAAELAAEG